METSWGLLQWVIGHFESRQKMQQWFKCMVAGILFRIIHCKVIKIPIQMSRQQSRESFFAAHSSPRFSTVYILTWRGRKSSARGLSKWDVSVLRATCLWFKLQFLGHLSLIRSVRSIFLTALRTQCDKHLKYWLMRLIRLKGARSGVYSIVIK